MAPNSIDVLHYRTLCTNFTSERELNRHRQAASASGVVLRVVAAPIPGSLLLEVDAVEGGMYRFLRALCRAVTGHES